MPHTFGRDGWVAVWLVVALLACPAVSHAVENDTGAWLIGTGSGAIGDADGPWRFVVDAQARYPDAGSGAAQYLLRPAVGRRIGGGMTAWLGYGRFETRAANGARSHENRYWQQLSWQPRPFASGTLALRARLAQRLVSNGDDTAWWLRLLARYDRPLGEGRPGLYFAIEPFIDLRDTDWSGDAGLRQNRAMFGLKWRLPNDWQLETGYMNQYLVFDNSENVSNHLLTLNLLRAF